MVEFEQFAAKVQKFLNDYLTERGLQPDSDPAVIQAALDQASALFDEEIFLGFNPPGPIQAHWRGDHIEFDFTGR